jgi:hypothetical protein
LEWCVALQELTGLENVFAVRINNCPNLLSLKGLGNNEKIVLEEKNLQQVDEEEQEGFRNEKTTMVIKW